MVGESPASGSPNGVDTSEMKPSPRSMCDAAAGLARKVLSGRVADLRPMPAEAAGAEPRGCLHRYRPPEGVIPTGPPVLFVAPLAAPARCYDLRRGCSLIGHAVARGRRTYLLDPGTPRFADRGPALAAWAERVLPAAIRAVSRDAGGQPVQLVGWCLGGAHSLLAATDPALPIASVAAVAIPAGPPPAPFPGGLPGMLGDRPEALLRRAFRYADIGGYLRRPHKIVTGFDIAEFLAQEEAVDHFLGMMPAAPGRTAEQVYTAFVRELAPAGDRLEVGGRRARLADVRVPVLLVAGRGDAVAPVAAVRSVARRLTGSPKLRTVAAPGGHLGVLTGPAARTTTWAHLDRWLDEGVLRHGIRAHRREAASV